MHYYDMDQNEDGIGSNDLNFRSVHVVTNILQFMRFNIDCIHVYVCRDTTLPRVHYFC